ncbi:uncharacterized protein LOC132206687 [Stegostoma tigrinum]|uniref:uncharacterized protein LOC132206687 n=1 Tax=Stegostoma tigrinum TaxID=3053191 RepID=UPI00286FBF25|nr:uncharacterized protein LOC132206687 [Stegostoma tigrinum]
MADPGSKSTHSAAKRLSFSGDLLPILDGAWLQGELAEGAVTMYQPLLSLTMLKWTQGQGSTPIQPVSETSKKIRNNFENSWTVLSTFSFTPFANHHGRTLVCELRGPGGVVAARQSLKLDVKYEPITVLGLNCTRTKKELFCICIVRANPPVTVSWNISGKNITGNTSDVTVYSWAKSNDLLQSSLTLTHPHGPEELIVCRAENENGVSVSKYQLNSTDEPGMIFGPNCTSSKNETSCICIVRANPPVAITWSISGKNITGNSSDATANSSAENNGQLQTSATLTHVNGSEELIICRAENENGVSVSKYQLNSTGMLPWIIVIPVGTSLAIIILVMIAVKVQRYVFILWKKQRDTVVVAPRTHLTQHPSSTEPRSDDSEEVVYSAVCVFSLHKPDLPAQEEEPNPPKSLLKPVPPIFQSLEPKQTSAIAKAVTVCDG